MDFFPRNIGQLTIQITFFSAMNKKQKYISSSLKHRKNKLILFNILAISCWVFCYYNEILPLKQTESICATLTPLKFLIDFCLPLCN